MINTSERLAGVRAKALLTLSLTARNDLIVEEAASDYGYDFLVRIAKGNLATNRMFAVELKASVRDSGDPVVQFSTRSLSLYKDMPFPVCLFFFFMRNDQGYYKWLVEPKIISDKPGLSLFVNEQHLKTRDPDILTFRSRDLTELNDESLQHIVDQVNQWYDLRHSA